MKPKTKRNIQRIIPFGIIWLVTGWYNLAIELMATGYSNPDPDAQITMGFSVFVFASIAVTSVGLVIGYIEVVWLEYLFLNKSFGRKLLYKFLLYSFVLLLIIIGVFPLAAIIELQTGLNDPVVWQKLSNFLRSTSFISTITSLAFSLLLSLIYSGISENIGYRVLINLLSGRYHESKEEKRIFFFLDMKSSTTIAELLGHKRYFKFLQDYYRFLSDSIIQHLGETYQYIGDEVVITWKLDHGLKNNNCINCFFAMQKALENKKAYFLKMYNLYPTFKAGIHMGEVTTGEIGALKKEIFYTGDVLNTASRLQGLCNEYQSDLLISEDLLLALKELKYKIEFVGDMELRGRQQKMKVYSIQAESAK
ncbi:MAG: adenylate/guanylate cyclase domain-containing protein [Vicingaceae bacterium]